MCKRAGGTFSLLSMTAVGSLLFLALTSPSSLSAQDPQLRPLSTHMEDLQADPLGTARYTLRRCAALYLLASTLSEGRVALYPVS